MRRFQCILLSALVLICLLNRFSIGMRYNNNNLNRLHKFAADDSLLPSEFDALKDLYYSTNGPYWQWINVSSQSIPWNFNEPDPNPCTENWQGVKCKCSEIPPKICHVDSLTLDNHHLNGPLPSTIGNLKEITILVLSDNNLTSSIPESFGNFTSLVTLDLHHNGLSGSIPTEFGLLDSMKTLNLYVNRLNGTLPTGIYSLKNLEAFQIQSNYLSGTISDEIAQMRSLQLCMIQLNSFSRQLPSVIGNLTTLFSLDVSDNLFTGPLPTSITNLWNLTVFIAGGNFFNGTIPKDLGKLTNLKLFDLTVNDMTGLIPLSVANLSSLESFYLNYNYFFGPFPESFPNPVTNRMFSIDISQNFFTGTIPATLHHWNLLQFFSVTNNSFHSEFPWNSTRIKHLFVFQIGLNSFSGSIPKEVFNESRYLVSINVAENEFQGELPAANWTDLTDYLSYVNYFSGKIPDILQESHLLNIFEISTNILSGTIPSWLGKCNELGYLNLTTNHFTGPISNLFSETTLLSVLTQLSLSNNYLTGTIPNSISGFANIHGIFLNDNDLSGTIPVTLASLEELEVLLLQDNQFTGGFPDIFSSPSLQNVDISSNMLTGTIPTTERNSPLLTLSVGSNCFSGSLPSELCNLKSVQVISFNGLATADSCRVPIFPSSSVFNSFLLLHNFDHGIPDCLFTMKDLQTLHLSGNGFTGTLPDSLNISSTLVDLSLSHNQLTGSIPLYIQQREWTNLDLSYNKLTGTLSDNFHSYGESSTLTLDINRLSGSIPSVLLSTENINILEGNIFICDTDHNNLPQNDQKAGDYSCGSDVVDYTLYVWLAVSVCVFTTSGIAFYYYLLYKKARQQQLFQETTADNYEESSQISSSIRSVVDREGGKTCLGFIVRLIIWRNEVESPTLLLDSPIKEVPIFLAKVRKLSLLIGGVIIVIYMPVYSTLGYFYRQYTNEDAWMISALLLSGQNAAICLEVFFFLLIILVILLLNRLLQYSNLQFLRFSSFTSSNNNPSLSSKTSKNEISENDRNVSFSSTQSNPSKSPLQKDKTSFAVFCFVFFLDIAVMLLVDITYVYVFITYQTSIVLVSEVMLAVFKTLLNNIILWEIIPYMKKMFFALYYKNTNVDELTGFTRMDLSFVTIVILLNNIVFPIIAVFIVSPDCIYSALFQAPNVSSSYTYTICDRYAGHVFVNFCFTYQTLTDNSSYTPPFIYNYRCASTIIINYVSVFIIMYTAEGILIPLSKLLLKFIDEFEDTTMIDGETRKSKLPQDSEGAKSLWNRDSMGGRLHARFSSMLLPTNLKSLASNSPKTLTDHVLFDKNRLAVRINSYLVVMMSFGVLFPPLALIVVVTIINVTIYEEIVIGRLLYESEKLGFTWYKKQLEKDCAGISDSLKYTLWSLVPVSSILYAYIIFDTWGDTEGWQSALTPTLIMLLVPITVLVFLNKTVQSLILHLIRRFTFCNRNGNSAAARTNNEVSEGKEAERLSSSQAHDIRPSSQFGRSSEIEISNFPQISQIINNRSTDVMNPIRMTNASIISDLTQD
jgi:Leucine-rich repeat (LRR) protein